MTKGQIQFNAIKDEYLAHYERTNGKPLKKLTFENGWVILIVDFSKHKVRTSQFAKMLSALKERPDFKPKEITKVAKLVAISLLTRVIVNENATQEEILAESKKKFQAKLDNNELSDNLDYIDNDDECPFDPETDK